MLYFFLLQVNKIKAKYNYNFDSPAKLTATVWLALFLGHCVAKSLRRNNLATAMVYLQQVAKIVETLHLLGALLISLLSLTLQPPSPPYQCC